MSVPCTKELLLSLIEDIELIARELIENSVAPKQNRMAAQDHKAVTELLVAKDKELKETLKLAAEQGEVEKEIELVRDFKRETNQEPLKLKSLRCKQRFQSKTSTSRPCRAS